MKNLNITYEDEDFKFIESWKNKSGLSWELFILGAVMLVNKHELKNYAYLKRERAAKEKAELLKDSKGGARVII